MKVEFELFAFHNQMCEALRRRCGTQPQEIMIVGDNDVLWELISPIFFDR